jgi:tetratricopeptide (TPR) repeat protein
VGSAVSAEQLNQVEKALGFWKQACQLAPFNAQYRASYCNALARLSQWNVLVSEAEEWVKLNPFSIEARVTLLKALIALQQLDRARTEFNIIERFNPPNILDLRIRYASKLGIITPN